MTTMEAIRKICDAKAAASRVPVLATVGEVSSATGRSQQETAMEMDLLAKRGAIMTGQTINEKYAIPNNNGGTRMKEFEKAIQAFLDEKAEKDRAFAEKMKSEKKSITECCQYIISEVKKKYRGKDAACSDEYVFGLAIHYYDEADLKVTGSPSAHVVVSRHLTEAEKEEARKEAEIQYLKEKEDAVKRAKEEEVRKNLERLRKEEAKAEAAEKRKAAAIEKKKQQIQQETCLFLFDDEEDQA